MEVVEGIVLLEQDDHFQVLDEDGAVHRFILSPVLPPGHNRALRQQHPGERVRVLYTGAIDPLTSMAHAVAWLDASHCRRRRVAWT